MTPIVRRAWTDAEDALLRVLYPDTPTHAIGTQLKRPAASIYNRAQKLGVRKSEAYLSGPLSGRTRSGSNRGGSTKFKPGSTPANKGMRRPGFAPGRMADTQWKPGAVPHTTVPVGTETCRTDGYVFVKRSEHLRPSRRNWVSKHQAIYEAAHGLIPAGSIVRFVDNDRTNFALDNLECVSRKQHVLTRGLHSLPPELAQIHQLRGVIIKEINRRQPPAPARRGRPPKHARSA